MVNYTLKELLECRMLMTSQSLEIGKIDDAINKIINELSSEPTPPVVVKRKNVKE